MASCDSKFDPEDLYKQNLSIFSGVKNPIIEAIEKTRAQSSQPPLSQPRRPMQPMVQPMVQQKFVFTQQPVENPTYITSEGLILSTLADGQWVYLNHKNKWCKFNLKLGRIFITREGFIALQKANGDCVCIYRY
jgi:hypothetical protein